MTSNLSPLKAAIPESQAVLCCHSDRGHPTGACLRCVRVMHCWLSSVSVHVVCMLYRKGARSCRSVCTEDRAVWLTPELSPPVTAQKYTTRNRDGLTALEITRQLGGRKAKKGRDRKKERMVKTVLQTRVLTTETLVCFVSAHADLSYFMS